VDPTDQPDFRVIVDNMLRSPHAIALGLKMVAIEPGVLTVEAPWREDLVGDVERQVIAAGVVTTLLDHVCGAAVPTLGARSGPTLDLRVDYMRPAAPRAGVTVEAHCYKLTRSIAFVRAIAWDRDRDDLVATAQAAFALQEPRS
jgi:uncharacterized protein (TIGR00369 family)